MSIKEKLTGIGTGVLVDIGRDMLAVFGPEILPLFNEWWKERSSPDGWTDRERLMYLYAAVSRIKAKTIGPSWFDHLGDFGLQAILRNIAADLDALDAADGGDEGEAPPPPPEIVEPEYWGVLLAEKPSKSDYVLGDYLWWNQATVAEAVRYTISGPTMAYPGWARIDDW